MEHYVKWIAPFRSALCAALVGFLLSYPAIGIMYVFAQFASRPTGSPFPRIMLITVPVTVAIVLFIFVALAAISYNLAARLGLSVKVRLAPNTPVNADARDVPASASDSGARAGYRER